MLVVVKWVADGEKREVREPRESTEKGQLIIINIFELAMFGIFYLFF